MSQPDFRTSRGAFLHGMARTLDLGATLSRRSYIVRVSTFRTDAAAMRGDWQAVGSDIARAAGAFQEEHTMKGTQPDADGSQ